MPHLLNLSFIIDEMLQKEAYPAKKEAFVIPVRLLASCFPFEEGGSCVGDVSSISLCSEL